MFPASDFKRRKVLRPDKPDTASAASTAESLGLKRRRILHIGHALWRTLYLEDQKEKTRKERPSPPPQEDEEDPEVEEVEEEGYPAVPNETEDLIEMETDKENKEEEIEDCPPEEEDKSEDCPPEEEEKSEEDESENDDLNRDDDENDDRPDPGSGAVPTAKEAKKKHTDW